MSTNLDGYDDQQIKELFLEDLKKYSDDINAGIEILVENPNSQGYEKIFKALHTLKGLSVYMKGSEPLIDYARSSCEYYRNLPLSDVDNEDLFEWSKELNDAIKAAHTKLNDKDILDDSDLPKAPESLNYLLE